MLTDNHEQPRPGAGIDDLDEIARQGRCAIIWWFSQATILLPMQFQYPERIHERRGRELTAHVDAEARRRRDERFAVRPPALGVELEDLIAEMGRVAAETRARHLLRTSAHARLAPPGAL